MFITSTDCGLLDLRKEEFWMKYLARHIEEKAHWDLSPFASGKTNTKQTPNNKKTPPTTKPQNA